MKARIHYKEQWKYGEHIIHITLATYVRSQVDYISIMKADSPTGVPAHAEHRLRAGIPAWLSGTPVTIRYRLSGTPVPFLYACVSCVYFLCDSQVD